MPEKTQPEKNAAVMLGMQMQDSERWSDRVFTALGQNPSAFTGPGTNTYLFVLRYAGFVDGCSISRWTQTTPRSYRT